jgi:Zn-dependent peptidase ImmA (M78 family)
VFPRKIETITDYLLEHLHATRGKRIPIKFHPRIYEAHAFMGTIEEFESKVDIYFDLNRNRCWKRFILAKELCHLLYDCPNSQHLASTPEQIGSLITQILAGLTTANLEENQAANSEQATVLMAIEILLPHSEREEVNRIITKGGNALAVAKHYLLPEQMVSLYLDTTYAAIMKKAYQDFPKQEKGE